MNINESFGYIVNTTARNIKKKLEAKIKIYDITTSQWAILKVLSKKNDLTQAEIAEKLAADRATTGAVIDKLINKNLVYRKQCENDRRANRVRISDYGQELAEKISCEAVECNCNALEGFSDEEIRQLVAYLKRININLNRG